MLSAKFSLPPKAQTNGQHGNEIDGTFSTKHTADSGETCTMNTWTLTAIVEGSEHSFSCSENLSITDDNLVGVAQSGGLRAVKSACRS